MTILLFLFSAFYNLSTKVFVQFETEKDLVGWQIVDDGVMGGLSKGNFFMEQKGNAVFEGQVSLENNGGFSSVRYSFATEELKEFKSFALYLKGDGKKYQFRVKEKGSDYFSYIIEFQTSGEWEKVDISFNKLYPSFRGRRLDKANFLGAKMQEMAILIGNAKAEKFRLEIDRIELE